MGAAENTIVVFFADNKRFSNTEVRKWAEEMVYLHCPAHVDPTILWLESDDLGRFETLHAAWLKAMRSSSAAAKTATAAPLPRPPSVTAFRPS